MEAFTVTGRWSPVVLQHLLLGINAHINLGLGIAAAQTVSAAELPGLRNDFDRINAVLAGLVSDVQTELAQIWPTLRFFTRYLGNTQTVVINFSMEKVGDRAWSVAEQLAPLGRREQEAVIAQLDREVARFARVSRNPGVVLGTVTRAVRLGERGSVRRKIDFLA